MVRICLSGLSGSGKTTIGDELARELNIEHIQKSYKDVTKGEEGLLEMQKKVTSGYERGFDMQVVELARGKNCVVTTWLGPWFIKDATLRVWLNASREIRVKRLMKLKGKSRKFIEHYVMEKDEGNMRRWKKIYNIDINDHSIFDLEINTEKFKSREAAAIIAMAALMKEKKRFG